MVKQDLIQRLMKTFLQELESEIVNLNATLLELEKTPEEQVRRELLQRLFRSAHSLKGAARSVGLTVVEQICHEFENLFTKVKESEATLAPTIFSLCFETVDALSLANTQISAGTPLGLDAFKPLINKLQSFSLTPAPGDSSPPAPTAALKTIDTATNATQIQKPTKSTNDTNQFVRITSKKLDELMSETGELFINWQKMDHWQDTLGELNEKLLSLKISVEENLGKEKQAPVFLEKTEDDPSSLVKSLQHSLEKEGFFFRKERNAIFQALKRVDQRVREMRMLPFADACLGLDRMVRDLALEQGKQVELRIEGSEVEMDRTILDQIKSPLLHLIRNSVDHGLEIPEERLLAGKPASGMIQISTAIRSSQVEIRIEDDGRGINYEAIRQKAQEKGIPVPQSERELMNLLFTPGFSTAKIITEISGRGIGLDVLKTNIEKLRGTVEMESNPGHGTWFTIRVPLTLTTLRTVLTEVGGQIYAIPTSNIVRLLRLMPEQMVSIEGSLSFLFEGKVLSVHELGALLGAPQTDGEANDRRKYAVIVGSGDQRAVWLVDRYLSEQELIVKNLGRRVKRLKNLAGATILSSGRVGLIINVAELLRGVNTGEVPRTSQEAISPRVRSSKKRILLVDDSLTTRSLEKSILESAGYEVIEASDGELAWKKLQESGADLIVSDVEMPNMTGLELTDTVRQSEKWGKIPVILVTSLCKDADKRRGLQVGANAYIVKGEFDQDGLLATVAQLL